MQIPGLPFAKGHGTGNDFVIVPDPDGRWDPPAGVVSALCDRHFGVGGDGLLRVVRTAAVPEVAHLADEAEWFMDYRNGDGSLAEMCGNGVRVYARYLVEGGYALGPSLAILTRAGRVEVNITETGIAAEMPVPEVLGPSTVRLGGEEFAGTVATCGNPNLVCPVPDPDKLDLTAALALDPDVLPAGANVEFYTLAEIGSAPAVRMRVVERGVGETLSCGSGACAAAAVALRDAGRSEGEVVVAVPGGQLSVAIARGRCMLAGPAVIVATGEVAGPSLAELHHRTS